MSHEVPTPPCHYIKGDNGERVLIPGCWGTVHTADMDDCYCIRSKRMTDKELTREIASAKLELDALVDEQKRRARRKELSAARKAKREGQRGEGRDG